MRLRALFRTIDQVDATDDAAGIEDVLEAYGATGISNGLVEIGEVVFHEFKFSYPGSPSEFVQNVEFDTDCEAKSVDFEQ